MFGAISAAGFHPSANLALAFALSRPLKQLRLPAELVCAAALAKAVPQMTRIKFTFLYERVVQSHYEKSGKKRDEDDSLTGRALNSAGAAVNKYGMAYLVSSRALGVASIFGLYTALQWGVDVGSWFDAWGYSGAGDALGKWAAAVVGGTMLWPFGIGMAPIFIPRIRGWLP